MTPALRERLSGLEGALLLVFAAAVSVSIAASEIAFLTALVLRVARHLAGDRLALRPRPVLIAALALLASWILAGAVSPEPAESLWRAHRLYQVAVVFVVAERAGDPAWAARAAAAYLLGVSVGSAIGLVGWWTREFSAGLTGVRMRGIFSTGMTSGNSLSMAYVAATAAAALAWRGARRAGAGLAGALAAVGLAATRTRSSWLGAVAGCATLAIQPRARRGAALAIAAFAILVLTVPAFRERAGEIGNAREYTAQGRLSLWHTGWNLFRERPVLGWGLADQSRRIEAHRLPDATFHGGHFHNNFVQIAVTTGAVGLIAYLAFHASLLAALWPRRRGPWGLAALGVWVAFHIAGCFDWSFGDAEVAYAFFLWMGLGAAENQEEHPPAR
jgi:O-antigen ligase